MKNYEEKIKTLFKPFPKRLGLNTIRISRLLQKLGDPHKKTPPIIHVAGTNGKGSTIAFLRAGLEASGNKVHVFSSPHLIDIKERILIAGEKISSEYFDNLLSTCIEKNENKELSFFELLTAIAFLAFSQNEADWTILEVGLGGRLDSTNIIERPRLGIITPISMDHEEFLGNSIRKIATEKAGIIKNGVKMIFAKQDKCVLNILKNKAKKLDCFTITQDEDFQSECNNSNLLFTDKEKSIYLPKPSLRGNHQVDNAGLAIAALLDLGCTDQALADSMINVYWPGRLQRITEGPLSPNVLGFNAELFVDGAHNPSGGKVIADWSNKEDPSTLFIIIGIMKNKNLEEFLKPFGPMINKLIAVKIPHEINAQDPGIIVNVSSQLNIPSIAAKDIATALQIIKKEESVLPKRILITGSLHLVGKFLEYNLLRQL